VIAIVGIVSCGLLSPIGLLLSLIALIWPPRGFAIAGATVGLLGSIWFIVAGLAMVLAFAGFGAMATIAVDMVETQTAVEHAATRIEEFQAEHGALPTNDEGQALIDGLRDGWDHGLRYVLAGETYRVVSSGPDGSFDTGDDLDQDSVRTATSGGADWD
jgi:hypothetical protein